jgi:hypothetical protein
VAQWKGFGIEAPHLPKNSLSCPKTEALGRVLGQSLLRLGMSRCSVGQGCASAKNENARECFAGIWLAISSLVNRVGQNGRF